MASRHRITSFRPGNAGIYQIRCLISGKLYIGSSNALNKRWNEHRNKLSKGVHHSVLLQRAWEKHGPENFVFEILELIGDKEELIRVEQQYLDRLQTCDKTKGYNIAKIADMPVGFDGRTHTPETKAKMSNRAKGRIFTPETRAKMRATVTGRKMSVEARAKMSAFQKARKQTPEHRAKIAASIRSPETRAKMSATLRGRKHSPDHVANQAATLRGRKYTPEHIANNRASRALRRKERMAKGRPLLPFMDED